MKPSSVLQHHRQDIYQLVQQNHVKNPRVFGSVLHGLDTETSDLDILVERTEITSLMDMARLQSDLESLLGVAVDVVTAGDLHPKLRQKILSEATAL
jgi:uncharacterized protein